MAKDRTGIPNVYTVIISLIIERSSPEAPQTLRKAGMRTGDKHTKINGYKMLITMLNPITLPAFSKSLFPRRIAMVTAPPEPSKIAAACRTYT